MDPEWWGFVSRAGNALLLLPTALAIALGLWFGGMRAIAMRWSACFAVAVLITFATKIAFLGWGIGSREYDFTGISGHSFLASSVLTMLFWWVVHDRSLRTRRVAIACGVAMGLFVGWSRLALDVHSNSEVITGLALGFATVAATLIGIRPRHDSLTVRLLVFAALLVACLLTPNQPTYEAHQLVSRIALALSGRTEVYTREALGLTRGSRAAVPPGRPDRGPSARSPA